MACGKPVISSELDEVKAVAGDVVRYCSSVDDYVQTITALYEDEALKRRLGAAGKRLVEAGYSWDGICRKLEAILTCAAKERPSTHT
jgi:glycosyltransferase involved in cell wall biosynthesis